MHSSAQSEHRSDSVTFAILERIAERTGTDPQSLSPMYDSIDPDIFSHLCGTDQYDETVELTFVYEGYEVTVNGRGDIAISDV